MPLMSLRPLILIAACLSLANGAELVDPEVSGTSIVAQVNIQHHSRSAKLFSSSFDLLSILTFESGAAHKVSRIF